MGQIFNELRKTHSDWPDDKIYKKGFKIIKARTFIVNMLASYRRR